MQWIRRHKYLVIVLLALLVVLAWVFHKPPHEVQVATAAYSALTLPIAASGLVESQNTDLAFVGSGRVAQVYVREGQAITRGELLARLSPNIPGTAGLNAEDNLSAPYDGTVVTIYQRAGAVVSPGQPVLRVTAFGGSWVTVFIESEDAPYLRRGETLQARAGGYLSRPWPLRIQRIGAEAVPRPDLPGSSRQVRVRCAIVQTSLGIPPGTEVDVDGEIPILHQALLIPTAAVVHEGAHNWVWLLKGDTVRRRDITIGPNNFAMIQVQSGLQAGDRVVVEGKDGLQEGQTVRARPMPPPTQPAEGE